MAGWPRVRRPRSPGGKPVARGQAFRPAGGRAFNRSAQGPDRAGTRAVAHGIARCHRRVTGFGLEGAAHKARRAVRGPRQVLFAT